MALTLAQGAQLANSASFLSRVRSAISQAALDVAAETQGSLSANAWAKRRLLAIRILNGPDSLVSAFAAAVAADPSSGLPWWDPVAVASSTAADPSVVTTASAHNLSTGDVVAIVGHEGNTAVNGTWDATALSATTFSVPQPGTGTGTASGTAQEQMSDGDLQFTVNSVFSAVAGLMPGE